MRKYALAASLIVVVLTGCSSDTDTKEGPDVNSVADGIEWMRRTVTFNYVPYKTPAAMLESADIAVVGEVASVDLALQELPPEHLGVVVVGLQPTEVWKDDTARSGDVVYYYFSRPNNVGVDPYRKALPEGTEVVLFGHDLTDDPPPDGEGHDPEPVRFVESDVTFDAIFSADAQGLFVEAAEDRLVSVWAQDIASTDWDVTDLDDLRAALGK